MNENNKEFQNVEHDLTPKQEKGLDKIIQLLDDYDLEIIDISEGMGY